jgi:hypothetical protein
MSGQAAPQAAETSQRCGKCGAPVRLEGDPLLPEPMRRAVHAADGRELGEDGHLAAPTGQPAGIIP